MRPELTRLARAAADRLVLRGGTTGIRVATALARLDRGLLPGPGADEVAAVLGPMERRRSVQLARQITVNRLRYRLLRRLRHLSDGPEPLDQLLRPTDVASLTALRSHPGPAIVVTLHLGYPRAVGVGLARMGLPVLTVRHAPPRRPAPAGVQELFTAGPPSHRARVLKRTADHLRGGGRVVMACDVRGPIEVEVLGRPLGLARGCLMLARVTGAPLIPATALWSPRGLALELRSWAPLPTLGPGSAPDDFERALAREVVRWWEDRLRASPDQLPPKWLERLTAGPRAGRYAAPAAVGSPREQR